MPTGKDDAAYIMGSYTIQQLVKEAGELMNVLNRRSMPLTLDERNRCDRIESLVQIASELIEPQATDEKSGS